MPRRPRVAILSTGDELCRGDEPPEGRIVDTNAPALALAVARLATEYKLVILSNAMDEQIVEHLKRRHNLLIGERTAEAVKMTIGSAFPLALNKSSSA